MHLTASFSHAPAPSASTAATTPPETIATATMSTPNLLENEHRARHANRTLLSPESPTSDDDLYIQLQSRTRAHSKSSAIPPSSSMPILYAAARTDTMSYSSSSSSDNVSGSAPSIAQVELDSPSTVHISTEQQTQKQRQLTNTPVQELPLSAPNAISATTDAPPFEVEPLNIVLGPREIRFVRPSRSPRHRLVSYNN